MSEEELPLQLPPRPALPRRRPWGLIAGATVGLVVALIAAALVISNSDSAPKTTVTAAATTTTAAAVVGVATTAPPQPATPQPRRARTPAAAATTTTTMPEPTPAPMSSELLVKLEALPVHEEHAEGYNSTLFGYWKDADDDGCNTAEQVLIDEATGPVTRNARCRVMSGQWLSPYDNVAVSDPDNVAVDHVVALREAWESGAWHWTDSQRSAYMNDLTRTYALVAVSKEINTAKGDQDPADWLPPRGIHLRLPGSAGSTSKPCGGSRSTPANAKPSRCAPSGASSN